MSRKTKQFTLKAAAPTVKATPDRVSTQEISSVDGQHIGKTRFVSGHLMFNEDDLVGRQGLKVFDWLRKDEQVHSALECKKLAAVSSGWTVAPPVYQGTDGKMAEELTDFINFNFNEMEGCTFENVIQNMLTALDYGFSCSERVWKYIDYGPYEGKVGLKYIKTRKPHFIEFDITPTGNLMPDGVVQNGERLQASRFIIYSYNSEFNNYYGRSDLRSCYKAAFVKDNVLKSAAVALERYGSPIAVAVTKKTLTTDERSRLEQIFLNLQSRTLIMIPEFIELRFEAPSPHVSEAFIPMLNKLDTWIRVAIMLPGLMGMSAEVGVGSFARSETEFEVFLAVIERIRKDLEAKINDEVVKPLIDLNYEVEGGIYPTFKFRSVNKEDLRKTFELFMKGTEIGLITKTPEDENVARELINIPKIDEAKSEPMITKIAADAQAKAVEISATRTQQSGTASKTSKNSYSEEDIVRIVTENIQKNGTIATAASNRRSK
jgi:phage gp29-like protein